MPGRNGGRLKKGNPGNKGGKGAVRSEVRQACTDLFSGCIAKLSQKIKSGDLTDKDFISAMEMLGRYGIGSRQEISGDGESPIKILHVSPDDY